MRRKVGHTVAKRDNRRYRHIVEFDCRGVSARRPRAERIDESLYDNVADGYERLLQNAGDCDDGNLFQNFEIDFFNLFVAFVRKFSEPYEHKCKSKNRADSLTKERRPRHAFNAHMKGFYENDIDDNVCDRRRRKKQKRGKGVAECRKYARRDIVRQKENIAAEIYHQVFVRIGENHGVGFNEIQERLRKPKPQRRQNYRNYGADDNGSRYRRFHAADIFLAEIPCSDDRRADIAPESNRNEQKRDFVSVADRGERVRADISACNKAVRYVVKLLENDTAEKG